MNIQQLRYVVMTAERGSMTAAAAALYVAQPALSRAIRLLERELDVTLFARSGRGVVLTADGEAFLVGARKVLRTLDELRGVGESTSRDAQLVIAATPTLQASMAVPILALLQQQGIAVHARLLGAGDAREVHELVGSGRADLGICDQVIESDLVAVPLGRAEVLLVSPPDLEAPDPITMAQLSGLPLVLPTSGTDRRAAFDKFFESNGYVVNVAIESDERSVWLEAVLSGLASCIWHSVDSLRAPLRGFSVRKFDPPMFQELSAVHRGDDDAPATLLLLDVLREFAALRSS